ncbi:MAG TPA: carboxypeptidase regulatory-like domain-containing protein, partial [Bryobacteraceae bacterium]|nr:carboxypeptidase regulatory-like domain-containing protein [Bryobacteraceae bacterium]
MTRKFLCGLMCAFIPILPVFGQEVSAGITGRVTDPSGAAIVGATVTAKDQDRGTEWPTKTNEDGIYAFPRIPIGRYELKVEASGFKTHTQSGITLEVNQRARIDATMEVGQVSESVTVTAEGAILQTETTQVGSVISSQTIVNAPLISRNPISLTLLAPGVTTADPDSFNNGVRTAGGGRPYVNGNRKESNNFLLDGVDNNQVSDNLSSYQPNLDAIAEFKMITNNASAEFGNFQGGIVNVVIKSGTNEMHGNVFEYFRNDKLNANNWANNWKDNARAPMRWNQFGGTLGGPIIKDKLFYFLDYQGLRRANPGAPSSITVIPTEWRNGDYSRLLNPSAQDMADLGISGPVQLYNPYATDAQGNRAPFPNNQIPKSMISPVAQALFNNTTLYPQPLNSNLRNNYLNVNPTYVKSDQGDFKLDWKIGPKDDFSGRYSNGRQDQPGVNSFKLLYNSFNIAPFQNGVINWTRTFNPNIVNEARFGVNNILLNNGGEDNGIGNVAQELGIQNAGNGLLSLQGFAYANAIGNANIGTSQLFANTTYHYADNLTIMHGRHMMKMGGQILRQQMNTFYAGNNGRTGFINFNGQFTQGPNSANPTSKAIGEADFLLGLPNDLGRGLSTGTWGHRKTIYGVYFQDDWRVTDNLTLNLGLRWEYHTPLVEVEDRQSNFGEFSGQLMLAGQDGNSRALYNGFKKGFQPRVGFAWTPGTFNKKVVLRGAYTISSFMEGTGTNLRLPLNPPFNSEFETRYDPGLYSLPSTTLTDGLSGLSATNPYLGANIRLWDPNVRPANTQQWNFTMEFQLPQGNALTVGYVGQHGTHLVVPMPYFQKQLSNGQILPSPYLAGNPTLVSQITQISGTESNGNQKYNALQVELRHRYASGLEYSLAYTWSHGMSDAIGYYGEGGQAGSQSAYMQNLYNRAGEWGPTYFDATHMFTGSFFYELPFGKGKAMGAGWNPIVNGILGGWRAGGILTLHSGFPLTITANDVSGTLSRGYRADVVGTPHNSEVVGLGAHWLDPSAYAQPAQFTFGNSGNG